LLIVLPLRSHPIEDKGLLMTILKRIADVSQPILTYPYIQRTRRNHGLEHATIHILSKHHNALSGRSDDRGFVLFGEVPTERVEQAVQEALSRMKNGEHKLAIHPNCGTNLVTTGFLATAIAWFGFSGSKRRSALDRFPMIMVLMMGVFLFSTPLGMSLQLHFTTDGDPGDMEFISVTRNVQNIPFTSRNVTIHRVTTQ
jgi:hypothetical protein